MRGLLTGIVVVLTPCLYCLYTNSGAAASASHFQSQGNEAPASPTSSTGFALVEWFPAKTGAETPTRHSVTASSTLARIETLREQGELPIHVLTYVADEPIDPVQAEHRNTYIRTPGDAFPEQSRLIVNGLVHLPSNGEATAERVLRAALKLSPQTKLDVKAHVNNQRGLSISWQAEDLQPGDEIVIAVVTDGSLPSVANDREQRRELRNVVRQLRKVSSPERNGELHLPLLDDRQADHVVAFVQSARSQAIRAALRVRISGQ